MANPAHQHYLAIRQVEEYLANTLYDGIYFWRETPRPVLPRHKLPTTYPDNLELDDLASDWGQLYAYVHLDWGTLWAFV
jgi:hypothetical protein